jgi:hypothetical protein
VVKWANDNTNKIQALKSNPLDSYLFSKFFFFRRMQFWMEKTAEKIGEYQEAKEEAKICGYWNPEESLSFTFQDYMENPTDFTVEKFELHLACAKELDWIDRMQSSDQEQEELVDSGDDDDESD